MKAVLENLLTEEFQAKVRPELPPHAMRDVLRSRTEYEKVRTGLDNFVNREDIEELVEYVVDRLDPGTRSPYNAALALIAAALEDYHTNFAHEYLSSLAELNSVELGMASRVAEYCLGQRTESASNTFGETSIVTPSSEGEDLPFLTDDHDISDSADRPRELHPGY